MVEHLLHQPRRSGFQIERIMKAGEVREELRAELERKYKLHHFSLQIKGRTYQLASIANVDQLLDEIIEQGPGSPAFDDEQIAYWAELWHAAVGLAEMIEEGKVAKAGDRVMEIGCGIGLCGIAAGFQGAEVVLTDYLPEALELARYNWLLNHETEPDCRILDWREPKPEWQTEILLASDVAYEKRAYAPLIQFFQQMIVKEGAIWLSEPGRSFTKSWVSQLTDYGFFMKRYSYFVTLQEIKSQVGIYQLTQNG